MRALGNTVNKGNLLTYFYKTYSRKMGFWDTADRMVWPPSLSRDRKWPCVT